MISLVAKFNRELFKWQKKNYRNYPWRLKDDIYSILVAEILLQKTNADKVVPVYEQFIKYYPSPEKLKFAKYSKLKKIIMPLGLYYKADILKKISRTIIQWGNTIPSESELLCIKGIGQYIARSILIHVKNERLSLLDPNFIRIYKRVFNLTSSKARPRTDTILWKESIKLLPQKNVSKYVYAILDFGALICTSKKPMCGHCPMHPNICTGLF